MSLADLWWLRSSWPVFSSACFLPSLQQLLGVGYGARSTVFVESYFLPYCILGVGSFFAFQQYLFHGFFCSSAFVACRIYVCVSCTIFLRLQTSCPAIRKEATALCVVVHVETPSVIDAKQRSGLSPIHRSRHFEINYHSLPSL